MHKKEEDKERTKACRAAVKVAAEMGGHGLHVHARIKVLRMEYTYQDEFPVEMHMMECWRWLDATWAALKWD